MKLFFLRYVNTHLIDNQKVRDIFCFCLLSVFLIKKNKCENRQPNILKTMLRLFLK
jgi:hypothetical protein